ncbi:MAG: exosortase family protein XrtF [Cyclobacteriaceae bacterium]|nr:exosortase family protein XrtF [Cyclobacteriaceae bacterium]
MESGLRSLLKENRKALLFLGKFVGLYLVLNTGYGLFIEGYSPGTDPITMMVARNTQSLLSIFYQDITLHSTELSAHVTIANKGLRIINVFEGCNSINVIIVFLVFMISYGGPRKALIKFSVWGIVILYAINLLRVSLLFWVAIYYPNSLYFFHKFFFTGIIYGCVFVLWYRWINQVRLHESGTAAD